MAIRATRTATRGRYSPRRRRRSPRANSVTVNLASGNPDVHDPTSVTIVLTRAPGYSTGVPPRGDPGGRDRGQSLDRSGHGDGGREGDGDGDAVAAGSGGAGHAHSADLLGRGPGRGLAHRSGRKRLLGRAGPVHPRQDGRDDGDDGPPHAGGQRRQDADGGAGHGEPAVGDFVRRRAPGALQGATPWSVVAGDTASVARTITEDTTTWSPRRCDRRPVGGADREGPGVAQRSALQLEQGAHGPLGPGAAGVRAAGAGPLAQRR